MLKKQISVFLVVLFVLSVSTDVFSQRRTSKRTSSRDKDRQEQKVSFTDKLNHEINLGNIGIGSGFSISLKGTTAYKPLEQVSIGGGGKFLYIFANRFNGPDESYFDYGGLLFARVKVTENFYLQGEYDFVSFDQGLNFDRKNLTFPLFGGGYMSGYGPWKYGIQLLFVASEEARDQMFTTIDYWITFSYNF
ncbi:MAG: hypothetical protein KJO50_04075 [Bacteroidia bacterium]|nr:hypothetical protein [Bacteroidia bacterium]